ncbi:NB-ARC domain [Musa troglodytarum]|uniref:NB-ARC domain n=1 Tax=Musa troglodytarum TaxID=320322 RepID=A0A9E7KCD5_9LILI|nr:NB-ARC domain [Musa troglodytarum]
MALGFVRGDDWNNRMEDVGEELIEELSSRSFFVNAKSGQNKFELHPILHEFAESVSDGEYFRFEGVKSGEPIRIPNKVRHVYVAPDDLLTVAEALCERKDVRSLVVVGGPSCTSEDARSKYNKSLEEVLKSLESLRLLVLSELVSGLPEAIGKLKHLRYLEVPGNAITEWPKSFCKLYHLQWLILGMDSNSVSLPEDTNKLSNLRCVDADSEAIAALPWIGNLIYLQELKDYRIQPKKEGFDIGQLKYMNQLRRLCIKGLQHVDSKEKAAEAVLEDKEYLIWLELWWSNEGKPITPSKCEGALGGLRPHPDLRNLKINDYKGHRHPCWMENKYLLGLERLEMWSCHQLTSLPSRRASFLRVLHLRGMDSVEEVGAEFYGSTDAPFPSLEELLFDTLNQWKKWDNGAQQCREAFPRLRKLAIGNCRSLTGPIALPSSLEELIVRRFAGGDSFDLLEDETSTSTLILHIDKLALLQSCLQEGHLASLRLLEIRGSFDLEAFAGGLEERLHHLASLSRLSRTTASH